MVRPIITHTTILIITTMRAVHTVRITVVSMAEDIMAVSMAEATTAVDSTAAAVDIIDCLVLIAQSKALLTTSRIPQYQSIAQKNIYDPTGPQ